MFRFIGFIVEALYNKTKEVSISTLLGDLTLKTLNKVGSSLPFFRIIKSYLAYLMRHAKEEFITTLLGSMLKESGIALSGDLWNVLYATFRKDTLSYINKLTRLNQAPTDFKEDISKIYQQAWTSVDEFITLSQAGDVRVGLILEAVRNVNSYTDSFFLEQIKKFVTRAENKVIGSVPPPLRDIYEWINKSDSKKTKTQDKEKEIPGVEWVILHSSWLIEGYFAVTDKLTAFGNLTLNMISSFSRKATYTYPHVPYQVWTKMRSSPNHAGTEFWNGYLHDWVNSQYRDYIRQKVANFKSKYDQKISKYFEDINDKVLVSLDKMIARTNFKITKLYNQPFPTYEVGSRLWYQKELAANKNVYQAIRNLNKLAYRKAVGHEINTARYYKKRTGKGK